MAALATSTTGHNTLVLLAAGNSWQIRSRLPCAILQRHHESTKLFKLVSDQKGSCESSSHFMPDPDRPVLIFCLFSTQQT